MTLLYLIKGLFDIGSIFSGVILVEETINISRGVFSVIGDVEINIFRCNVIESCHDDCLIVVERHFIRQYFLRI